MASVGAVSYSAGALLFLLLTLLLVTAWRGRLHGALLVLSTAASTLWCGAVAFRAASGGPPLEVIGLLEILRSTVWLVFLLQVLKHAWPFRFPLTRSALPGLAILSVSTCLAMLIVTFWQAAPTLISPDSQFIVIVSGHLLLAVAGLVLVERLFRSVPDEKRWAVKSLCLGLGGMFAFDFYLYSNALLVRHFDLNLWNARGAINAMVVPLIAVSAARNPEWSVEVFVSRHVVFRSIALVGAGAYLLLMAAAGYYIRGYGGTWGSAAQIAFSFAALVLLILLLFSGQLRSEAKVFISKHFYKNKYDYRVEWLHFTLALSGSVQSPELRKNIIRAIASIVESPGGILWERKGGTHFYPLASHRAAVPEGAKEPGDSSLVRFLTRSGWVLYLDEYERSPDLYPNLELPAWISQLHRPWMVVPFVHASELVAFTVIMRSETKRRLDWEDTDLLKTVGRQAASYIALLNTSEELAESRQFEAFNRLSSYVVHDLKNLAAQLSLVVANARKYKDKPDFVLDAIDTVENATVKMNSLLSHLRKGRLEDTTGKRVSLKAIAQKVITARSAFRPIPSLKCEDECEDEGLFVRVDPVRLAAVLEHLVQNGQEATPEGGTVTLRLRREPGWALMEIEDTGSGMDERFIAERLYRPFDTTKGNAGMGIGVYESRDFVRSRGGDMEVHSSLGKGTVFRLKLPLDAETAEIAVSAGAEEVAAEARAG